MFSSENGCPAFQFNQIWNFLNDNAYILGAFLLAFGLFFTFAGRKVFKPAICLITTITVGVILTGFMYSVFLNNESANWVGWLIIAGSAAVGAVAGVFLAKFTKLGVALLAAWGGVAVGLMSYTAFLYMIKSQVFFYCFIVACAGVFAILTCCLFDHVLIISTSLFGSYLLMKGIGCYAGGFPNEATLYDEMSHGQNVPVTGAFYGYLAGFVLTFIAGAVVQYKIRSKETENGRHPYYKNRV